MSNANSTQERKTIVFVDPDTRRVTIFSDRDWKLARYEPEGDKDQVAILAESSQARWLSSMALRPHTVIVGRVSGEPFKILEKETSLMRLLGIEDYELEDEDREFEDLEEEEDGEQGSLYEEGSGYTLND